MRATLPMKTKIVYAVVSDEISLLNNSLYKLYIYHPRIYSWFNALAAQILKLTQPKKKKRPTLPDLSSTTSYFSCNFPQFAPIAGDDITVGVCILSFSMKDWRFTSSVK